MGSESVLTLFGICMNSSEVQSLKADVEIWVTPSGRESVVPSFEQPSKADTPIVVMLCGKLSEGPNDAQP